MVCPQVWHLKILVMFISLIFNPHDLHSWFVVRV